VLYRALRKGRDLARAGERSADRILGVTRREIAAEPAARLDYLSLVDSRTLLPVRRVEGRVLMPVAAYFGRTRLIDNVEFTAPRSARRRGA
jgi:pantoate--beta-alanine ligase